VTHGATRGRLLVLTQVYRPEPNFISADVAEAMARHMDVVAVTALPNYPHGRFYPGVRPWRPTRTVENGVTVWRLPLYPYHGRSQLKRALSYLSFVFVAAIWSPLVAGRPDIVWVYHGPFTTGLAALWFKLLYRARLVITCADLWPESFLAAGVAKPGRLMKLLFSYRRAINRRADTIICATRGTFDQFVADGLDPATLHHVPVWVEGIRDLASPEHTPEEPGERRRIVYAGNLGPAQSLETLVRAAAAWLHEGVDVLVDLYGTGNSEAALKRLAHELGATNVTFHGTVPPGQAFEVSSRAFAQVVSLQPSPLFSMTVPSKISFCCAAGAPLLYGLQGEPAAMVAESGGGIPFDVSNPASLVAAVKELIARTPADRGRMRANLQQYYRQHLARPLLIARYEQILLSQRADPTEKRSPALDWGGHRAP
jgi:glycosyltransferase involved in cell wall biosynthesis